MFVELDENKFDQVLTNLIENAFKFTPRGGGITVFVTFIESQERVLINVTDTGVGISSVCKYFHSLLWNVSTFQYFLAGEAE